MKVGATDCARRHIEAQLVGPRLQRGGSVRRSGVPARSRSIAYMPPWCPDPVRSCGPAPGREGESRRRKCQLVVASITA
jgi:hypothetical protein